MSASAINRSTRREGNSLVFPLDRLTSGYLDAIRALAAFIVVLNHWRGMFFVEYHDLAAGLHAPWIIALLASGKFGHQAVMIFFVLSGFLISSSIVRKLERRAWSWKDYALDRSVRLYLVLIPGLVLGGVWDWLGMHVTAGRALYIAPLPPFGTHVPAAFLNTPVFLGNALFLQTRVVGVFGSNGPLWSLFNEGWYYVLFPALVCVVLCFKKQKFKVVAYLVLAGAVTWLLGAAAPGFIIWLSGLGVAVVAQYWRIQNRALKAICFWVACALFFGSMLAAGLGSTWLGSDMCVGLSFALLLYGVLQLRIDPGRVALKVAKEFSGFSYTLYLVHFPFLLFLRAAFLQKNIWQPDLRHILLAGLILPVVLAYAYAVAQLTEKHTATVRNWLRSSWVAPAKAPALSPTDASS